MKQRRYLFSSESVTEGHPDKVCDYISDSILDACLEQDPHSRVACETFAKSNMVVIGGEITSRAEFSYHDVVRQAIRDIGYTFGEDVFNDRDAHVLQCMTRQSPDIAQGVDARKAVGKATGEQGAGDQGLMFGFACRETPVLMPAPITFAHRLGQALSDERKSGRLHWLRPDGKTQVSVVYEGYRVVHVDTIVISTQHVPEMKHSRIASTMKRLALEVLPPDLLDRRTRFLVNPTGRFVIGGPQGDAGVTGRKIIVDTYGGMGRHGGGAFSGKDPSKVDRSAAYMGRYVAKNIVAAGLADRCEVQFAYAIGFPEPVSMSVNCFGTSQVSEERIERAVREVFSFKPANIIKQLDLLRPIYRKTTNYGHFGKKDKALTWEKTDRVKQLLRAVGA
jgi:S-adenosylmethionine synthetase